MNNCFLILKDWVCWFLMWNFLECKIFEGEVFVFFTGIVFRSQFGGVRPKLYWSIYEKNSGFPPAFFVLLPKIPRVSGNSLLALELKLKKKTQQPRTFYVEKQFENFYLSVLHFNDIDINVSSIHFLRRQIFPLTGFLKLGIQSCLYVALSLYKDGVGFCFLTLRNIFWFNLK